jgi:uncharacterized protein (DUF433 family)
MLADEVQTRSQHSRITRRPDQMGGTPCIRALRIPVSTVLAMLADGMSEGEILRDFPDLEPEDIRAALAYAAEALRAPKAGSDA